MRGGSPPSPHCTPSPKGQPGPEHPCAGVDRAAARMALAVPLPEDHRASRAGCAPQAFFCKERQHCPAQWIPAQLPILDPPVYSRRWRTLASSAILGWTRGRTAVPTGGDVAGETLPREGQPGRAEHRRTDDRQLWAGSSAKCQAPASSPAAGSQRQGQTLRYAPVRAGAVLEVYQQSPPPAG